MLERKERRVMNVGLYIISCICLCLFTLVVHVLTPESPCFFPGFSSDAICKHRNWLKAYVVSTNVLS